MLFSVFFFLKWKARCEGGCHEVGKMRRPAVQWRKLDWGKRFALAFICKNKYTQSIRSTQSTSSKCLNTCKPCMLVDLSVSENKWPQPCVKTSKREVGGCLSVVTLFESSSLTHQVASSKLILFRPDDHKFYELGVLLFESCNLKRVAGNICERCWGIYSDRLMYENGIWPLFSRNSPASCLMMIIVPICSCSA